MNLKPTTFPPSLSYWEIEQYLKSVDLLIIGSGIVGLTTAVFFKRKHPNKRVVIAEKGFLPSGASTKNAGFACFGSLSEILADLKNSSEEDVFKLIAQRYHGLNELRQLLHDDEIDYKPCGGYEIFRKNDQELFEKCEDFLPEANKKLKDELGLNKSYVLSTDQISNFGFRGVSKMILNQFEGSIDTGKMMTSLLRLASKLGIVILNSLELSQWSDNEDGVQVAFTNGLEFKTDRLHLATNGFTKRLLPEMTVDPARAQVLVTSPIHGLKFEGTFHLDEGYYYFRNIGNRVLFGGGRSLDFKTETTTELEVSSIIQNRLEQLLQEVIIPNEEYQIEHRWAGIMGVGGTKKAIVKELSSNVSCAVRLGGMGVAIGTSIGKESAELIG